VQTGLLTRSRKDAAPATALFLTFFQMIFLDTVCKD
jgi:hypothetical protein